MSPIGNDKSAIASVVLMERIVRDIYPSKKSSAIQPLQWSILRYLMRMPVDRREQRWIANFLGLTGAPVTRALRTLETRGLVSQQKSETDNRAKTFSLTDAGVAVLESDPILRVARLISSWPLEHQELFARSIRTLALDCEQLNGEPTKKHSDN